MDKVKVTRIGLRKRGLTRSSASLALVAGLLFATVVTPPGQARAFAAVGAPRPGGAAQSGAAPIQVCGEALCAGTQRWFSYGATIYNPGLTPPRSGMARPESTVALARQAHLNTIRITNFLTSDNWPRTGPYSAAAWRRVDAMIAAAGAAGMRVDLGLGDYRNMLWNDCVDPYRADWSRFVRFVANRVNTVTGRVYKHDPTIAFVSMAGEPLPVGRHTFTAMATNRRCSISYSTRELTHFYATTLGEWVATGATVLIDTGGLGYLNEPNSGIAWRSIMALPDDAFCAIKTYGGMAAFAGTVAQYCARIGKPLVDEEFGWTQAAGDARRARDFSSASDRLHALGVAGVAFWNLGYERAAGSYDVGPHDPLTWAAVQSGPT